MQKIMIKDKCMETMALIKCHEAMETDDSK